MLTLRKSEERGQADFGWLKARYTFSFGQYYEPAQMGFSDLRVINHDTVQPGGGFETHPHKDMEIFTYVLEGALEHKDSMGTGSVIRPGDVQVMSAGTGVRHSEFNHSQTETVELLQIWIVPDKLGIPPRYQQATFPEVEKRGRLRLILSPDGREQSLKIQQQAFVFAGLLDGKETITQAIPKGRSAYVHVARGELKLNDVTLRAGDGVKVYDEASLRFTDGKRAEVLFFELNRA